MRRQDVLERLRADATTLDRMGVASLSLFGSAASDRLRETSDIDILVRFADEPTFDAFMDVKLRLEDVLGRKVDLVTEAALKPAIRDRVLREALLVA